MDEETQSRLTDDFLAVVFGTDVEGFIQMMTREKEGELNG